MSHCRRRGQAALWALAPLATLAVGFVVDYAYGLVGEERLITLLFWPYWPAFMGLNALFGAAAFLYVWYMLKEAEDQPLASIVSLVLSAVVFSYPHLFPALDPIIAVRLPEPLERLYRILRTLHPRSYFVLMIVIMTIAASVGLWRYARTRRPTHGNPHPL